MIIRAGIYVLCGGVLWAAACSFLKPKSDPTQYFVLSSDEGQPPHPSAQVVGIDRIELPEYLTRPELVTRTEANQLKISDYERWGEPLKDGFSRTLRTDLERQLGLGHAVAAPFDPTHRPAVTVDVEVRRFEKVTPEGAVLEATWTLRDSTSGPALETKAVRLVEPLPRSDTRATVAALSQALSKLASLIAQAVRARS